MKARESVSFKTAFLALGVGLMTGMGLLGCGSSTPSGAGECTPSSFTEGGLTSRPAAWDQIQKVVVVFLENTEVDQASVQPYQSTLPPLGARIERSYGVTRPSQPNYLAFVGGDTFGVDHSNEVNLPDTHLADLIESAGKTWKIYAEDFPGSCDLSMTAGAYVRRHVPFLNFTNVTSNPTRCARVVNAAAFDSDLLANAHPDLSIFIPNNNSNGHDTSPAFADLWLQAKFGSHFSNAALLAHTLFILTYDEGGFASTTANWVYTVFLGAGVQPGSIETACINHYGILATLENILQLGSLGRHDVMATQVRGIWQGL